MDLLDGDAELTEFEAIDVQSIKGVGQGANGFPILMMKGVAAPVAKGARDCPKCDKTYDADHEGDNCEGCGAKLPVAKAADSDGDVPMDGEDSDGAVVEDGKPCPLCGQEVDGTIVRAHVRAKHAKAEASKVDCPTCKGDGKIRGNSTDCPDCDGNGKVTPGRRKEIMGKSLASAVAHVPGLDAAALLKAMGADGQVDEQPDIDTGDTILHLIGQAIAYEAQELMAGKAGEISDIFELACAAEKIWMWRTGETAVSDGSIMPATALMQSAWEYPADDVVKDSRTFTADERKKQAAEGNSLPDGSYPIPDADALRRAAILARSGHGDAAAAKKLIARRAKELGVKNPLEDDKASKGAIADGAVIGDTDNGIAETVKALGDDVARVTKALAASEERSKSLEAELAKVKAMPIPGGPMMSAAGPQAKAGENREDWAAKAAYYRDMADTVSQDPEVADGYRKLARQAEERMAS